MSRPNILSDRQLERMYNDFLDEVYGEVTIGAYKYSTSNALKNVDETAWNEGYNNWIDSEIDNGSLFESPCGGYTLDDMGNEEEEQDND